MTYALLPDGIEWPRHQSGEMSGKPSFKLEHLTQANGIAHEAAHDALSDVRATIALARLIRDKQPRLFDFALSLHKKDRVAAELRLPASQQTARPFLHISGMFSPERGCLAVMWPLASHPVNKNELIAWDLAHDPSELARLDAAAIRQRLFTRADDLPEGVQRLPLKTVHLNKSPMVVGNVNTLAPAMAERWQIDLATAARHAEAARALPDMSAIWAEVFQREAAGPVDVDQDLYGGFVGNEDRRRLARLRALPPGELAHERPGFDDERLGELLWRYRARNFPETLTPEEHERWEEHRAAVLMEGEGGGLTFDALFERLDTLGEQADERANERDQAILGAIYDYAESIAPGM
jgi:exodeoxyribonuclease-1